MEKQINFIPIEGELSIENGGTLSIETLLSFLEELKNKGATNIDFYAWVDEGIDISGSILREETDEEFEKRTRLQRNMAEAAKKRREEKDRTLYEELKKRFEK